jgi:cell division protein FtsX
MPLTIVLTLLCLVSVGLWLARKRRNRIENTRRMNLSLRIHLRHLERDAN